MRRPKIIYNDIKLLRMKERDEGMEPLPDVQQENKTKLTGRMGHRKESPTLMSCWRAAFFPQEYTLYPPLEKLTTC